MNIDDLPNNIDELKDLLIRCKHDLDQAHEDKVSWKNKYEALWESFRLAKQRRFGSSSESNILQGDLFDEPEDLAALENAEPDETTEVPGYKRKKNGKRKPLPEHFPREIIVHDISDEMKKCECGCNKTKIGELASEQLEVIPPSFKVLKHIRPKYACEKCEMGVDIAPMPKLLLPKSIAAPGMVAYTIIAKYQDHLPLYRQEQIWKRYGIDLPRNTLCQWILKVADKCERLYDLIGKHILSGRYIQADETPVQVLKEPGRESKQKSYIWVYRGGPPNKKAVLFNYQETREAMHVKKFLEDFSGYLQSDGYSGYEWANKSSSITHLCCMAHARRPFAELVKISKKIGRSHEVVSLINKLYKIEDEARPLAHEQRYLLRLEKSRPILEKINQWIEKTLRKTPPKEK